MSDNLPAPDLDAIEELRDEVLRFDSRYAARKLSVDHIPLLLAEVARLTADRQRAVDEALAEVADELDRRAEDTSAEFPIITHTYIAAAGWVRAFAAEPAPAPAQAGDDQ